MTVGIANGEKWVADTSLVNIFEYRDPLSQEVSSHSCKVIRVQGEMIELALTSGIALEEFHILFVIYLHKRNCGLSIVVLQGKWLFITQKGPIKRACLAHVAHTKRNVGEA